MLEQFWQRHDGQAANREHLLMALADLEAIFIKATYTTNTREAALIRVSLDVAEERNTGQGLFVVPVKKFRTALIPFCVGQIFISSDYFSRTRTCSGS